MAQPDMLPRPTGFGPATFDDIIGQDAVVTELRRFVQGEGGMRGVILFGPDGVGKHALARVLGRALLCDQLDERAIPCGVCNGCHIDIGLTHIDGPELDRETFDRIGVQENNTLLGCEVIVIDRADELDEARADKMLRRLEESRVRAHFILLARELKKVRGAGQSRCRSYRLRPLTDDDSGALLDRVDFEGARPEIKAAVVAAGRGLPAELIRRAREIVDGRVTELQEALVLLGLDWPGSMIAQWIDSLRRGLPPESVIGAPTAQLDEGEWSARCRTLLFCLHDGAGGSTRHADPALFFFQTELEELRKVWLEGVGQDESARSAIWRKISDALNQDEYVPVS